MIQQLGARRPNLAGLGQLADEVLEELPQQEAPEIYLDAVQKALYRIAMRTLPDHQKVEIPKANDPLALVKLAAQAGSDEGELELRSSGWESGAWLVEPGSDRYVLPDLGTSRSWTAKGRQLQEDRALEALEGLWQAHLRGEVSGLEPHQPSSIEFLDLAGKAAERRNLKALAGTLNFFAHGDDTNPLVAAGFEPVQQVRARGWLAPSGFDIPVS